MVTWVLQRTPHDCMICSIAMAIDKTYEEVEAAAIKCGAYDPAKKEGIYREYDVLKELGLKNEYKNGRSFGNFQSRHRAYEISHEYFRMASWGRPTIFSVPSLNKEGGHHAIFYDGIRIYDPSPLIAYGPDDFDKLMPSNAVWFQHGVIKFEGNE